MSLHTQKKEIFFITNNPYKVEELKEIFEPHNIEIKHVRHAIKEIQTDDIDAIIIDKTLKAFEYLMKPVIVDHSGLSIDALGGLPKGLTQLFWDSLQGDKICKIVDTLNNRKANAVTCLGFCDGKNIYSTNSVLEGQISDIPKGGRDFQWDSIFIPEKQTKAYSEMTVSEKNKISQRKKAATTLISKLKQTHYL